MTCSTMYTFSVECLGFIRKKENEYRDKYKKFDVEQVSLDFLRNLNIQKVKAYSCVCVIKLNNLCYFET